MTALKRLARSAPAQRLFRSAPARRVASHLVTAQRAPVDLVADHRAWAELERRGPAALDPTPATEPLRVAFVVPFFRRGSGGHTTIANLVRGLEQRGLACEIYVHDPSGGSGGGAPFRTFFGPFAAPVHDDLGSFAGADVVVATGWQTVAPVLLLAGCRARVQLVQDDEAEFYPASAERRWAEQSHVLPAITAGTWLADRMRGRGVSATPFDLGIDHAVYRPLDLPRDPNRVLFYARTVTARRAVPLGLLALEELRARRPQTTIALFGDATPLSGNFIQLGILDPADVARAYAQAAVGVVLSLTNHSLVAQEMVACGLPAVELRMPSTEAAFGDSPIELAEPTVLGLADAIERVLDDPGDRSRAGIEWAATRTWDRAAAAMEAGLRAALG